jgi:hypothetical protein
MRKKIFIAAGLALFGLTAGWQFGLVRRLAQRIPSGWTWKADLIGINAYPDPQTGKLSDKDSTSVYQRRMYIASEADRPRSVMLEDTNLSLDPTTGKKIWEYIYRAQVDPQTGAHLKKEYLGDYYLFPRFVEKKTYKFRNNYIKGVPLSFQRQEEIEGVQTYLFSYRGYGEYTESYVGTPEAPGVKIEPGQEIRCDDDQFIVNAWVEPVTGEILRLDEGCSAGDSFYDKATGRRLGPLDRWAGKTAGDDDIQRAEIISRDRSKLLWITRYIPLTLLLAGGLCFGLAFVPGRVPKNEDENA